MKALKRLYYRWWRLGIVGISLTLIAYLLYFHHLKKLLSGYGAPELQSLANTSNWHAIVANPVDAPYKIIVWLLTTVLHQDILMTRIVAASFGIIAVLLFYNIIRRWYAFRTSFFATIMFATSAGFLHAARFGSGLILQMAVLAFISSVLMYRRYRDRRILIGYLLSLIFAIFLYIPGLVWFELLGVVLFWKIILNQLHLTPKYHITGWAIIFLGVISPILYATMKDPHLTIAISGLPESIHALTKFGSNLVNAILSIGIHSNGSPLYWVGHAPLLNIVELVLMTIGLYATLYLKRTSRAIFWAGCIGLSILLISFGGSVGFAILVPLLYLFVVAGLDHLEGQWLRVFPRNPIARNAGIALVAIMLFFSVMYQVRSYFIAWPHATATKQAFDLQPPE